MRHLLPAALLLLFTPAFPACDKSNPLSPDPLVPGTITLTRTQQEYVQATNHFGLNLSAKVFTMAAEDGKDFIFSPISVGYLLGMLGNGASGETAKEICTVLGYGEDDIAAINEFCKTFMNQSGALDKRVILELANAIVASKGIAPLKETFTKPVRDNYYAAVEVLDFSDTQALLDRINGWCNEKTHGMIPKILEEVESECLVYLMNAIYFKGDWSQQFDPNETRKENFTKQNGDKVQVDMMNIDYTYHRYWTPDFETLAMPYGNGSFRMTFFLPASEKSVEDVIGALNPEIWAEIQKEACPKSSRVKVPRFETESFFDLKQSLIELGMPSAFGPGADFSAMSDYSLFISFILQKARIKVDEVGSEAAAITITGLDGAVGGSSSSAFFLNRPFLYTISESSTGAILFIGSYGMK